MSLEQTIKDTLLSESVDLDMRLQQLVRAGLMPANTIPLLRKGIAKVQGGYPLVGAERDVMANFLNSMMFIVLGDDTIFNKARTGAKRYATESKEKSDMPFEGPYRKSGEREDEYGNKVKNVAKHLAKKAMKANEDVEEIEEKRGLWDNIHAKRKRIKAGSGERMRKPGSEGAPSAADLKNSRVDEGENKEMKDKDPCWKGYQMVGMKKKGGKEVPNCVPANEEAGKGKLASYMENKHQGKVVANTNDPDSMKKYTTDVVKRAKDARKALAKESRRAEALADIAAVTQMNESYKTTFNAALTQYGIKSPSELDEEKRKEFFNFVDQNYKKGDN